MTDFVLFVGGTDETVAKVATTHEQSAQLIDRTNIDSFKFSVGFTSLGDLDLPQFVQLLERADEIYYVEPASWGHPTTESTTKFWMRYYQHRKPVHGFTNTDIVHAGLTLQAGRQTEGPQLWAVGCCYAKGTGLENVSDRWSDRLGQMLGLPVTTQAAVNSSLSWAADQILRSDIRKGDILVWGIASIGSISHWDDRFYHITHNAMREDDPKYDSYREVANLYNEQLLTSDDQLYKGMAAVQQVVADSRKVGYTLVLTQFPVNHNQQHELAMLNFLSQYDCFVHNYVEFRDFIDCSNSPDHPGPLQHQYYANLFANHLKGKTK